MGLLLVVGGVLVAFVTVGLGSADVRGLAVEPGKQGSQTRSVQVAPNQASAVQLVGAYSGVVKLDVVVGGVYSDTLAIPPAPENGAPAPPDLGSIDLALQLNQAGNALSGYVTLDNTLVYSAEHTLATGAASINIGPYVTGAVEGANFTLQSEKVSLVVNGRTIQRQFRLAGTGAAGDGSQMTGQYRETLWGYTSAPVTVIGAFTLQRARLNSTAPGAGNQAPTTVADMAMTPQGVAVMINVLANDSDANGDALAITSTSKPQFGAATTDSQTVIYTPSATFVGIDSFSYFVSDGKGGVDTGSVTIRVGQEEAKTIFLPMIAR